MKHNKNVKHTRFKRMYVTPVFLKNNKLLHSGF